MYEVTLVVLLDKAKIFCFDGEQKFVPQNGSAGIEGDVESRDARVCGWEVIVAWPYCDRWHRLEAVFGCRKCR